MTTKPKSILVKGACASLLLTSVAAIADDPTVPTQIVDLANRVDGVHPGFRAFHAKGVVVEGTFKASAEAAHLSSATLSPSTIPTAIVAGPGGYDATPRPCLNGDGGPVVTRLARWGVQ